MHHALKRAAPARHAGFTIIEFMIAITLSLLVLAALTGTFVANSRARNEIERANQQIENGRYALQILTDDLELAGYYSHFNIVNASLPSPGSKPDPCATSVATLNASFMMHIQGYDNLATLAALTTAAPLCAALLTDWKPGTDIVVIRRAATCRGGIDANCAMVTGAPYFQASLCASATELNSLTTTDYFRLDTNTGNLDRHKRDCGTVAELHQFMTNIYYVARNDQTSPAADGIPTLKRLELGAGSFTSVPLAHGIRDLQVEYGVDTDGDGAPNAFTANPDTYGGALSCNAACVGNWMNVVSVRLNVLAQNSYTSPDFLDNQKIYTLGLNAAGGTQCANDTNGDGVCEVFGDAYKKHVYQTSVRLMNPAGRRES